MQVVSGSPDEKLSPIRAGDDDGHITALTGVVLEFLNPHLALRFTRGCWVAWRPMVVVR
jgi:hypothetical protein